MGPALTITLGGLRIRCPILTPVVIVLVVAGLASHVADPYANVWTIALVATLGYVAILALHELARLIAYRRGGVRVRGLELTITGAAPLLVDHTANPRRETLAGLSGFVTVAGLALAATLAERATNTGTNLHAGLELLSWLALALALVQTLPVLPLDGGRLVRALVWYLSDDPIRGSRAAAVYGHIVSAVLIGAGAIMLALDDTYPWWGLAAVVAGLQFVTVAARSVRDSVWQHAGRTLSLASTDLPYPRKIDPEELVEVAVDGLIAEGNRAALLVIEGGEPIGIVRMRDLRRVRRSEWSQHRVREIMTPATELLRLDPETLALDAVLALDAAREGIALSRDERGVNIVVQRDVLLDHLAARAYQDRLTP